MTRVATARRRRAVRRLRRRVRRRAAPRPTSSTPRRPARSRPTSGRWSRQAYAGLLWTQAVLPLRRPRLARRRSRRSRRRRPSRLHGRNGDWRHLYNRDVISMPDKWEYPWYAAWDLAFHMIPFARIDPSFAKEQLAAAAARVVHAPERADAGLRVRLRRREPAGARLGLLARLQDRRRRRRPARPRVPRARLPEAADQLHLVGQPQGRRRAATSSPAASSASTTSACSTARKPLPDRRLRSSRPTAPPGWRSTARRCWRWRWSWPRHDPVYEDIASKFFEHFVAIADAMNTLGGTGLWDEAGRLLLRPAARRTGNETPLRVRSMVGLMPLFAVEVLDEEAIDRLPASTSGCSGSSTTGATSPTASRVGEGAAAAACCWRSRRASGWSACSDACSTRASSSRRTASARCRRRYDKNPYRFDFGGQTLEVDYEPGESTSGLFGGNSNWRGPVWLPVNYLLIEALERYHHFYGDDLRVECPVGEGAASPWARWRASCQPGWPGSSCPAPRPPALPRRRRAVRRRSPLARSAALLRVLPR